MKIGNYVRTNHGIYKIKNINENKTKWKYECLARDYVQDNDGSYTIVNFSNEMIIKSSPNIIDLIETGDYVNRYKVSRVNKESEYAPNNSVEIINGEIYLPAKTIDESKIESIVTKEQFEMMEYKVR